MTCSAPGDSVVSGNVDFSLVRLNTNGSLDTTFGTGGKVFTNIQSTAGDSGYSVALQSDGKILVGGKSFLSGTSDFALVRYQTDPVVTGSLSATVDGSGNLIPMSLANRYRSSIQPTRCKSMAATRATIPSPSPASAPAAAGLPRH